MLIALQEVTTQSMDRDESPEGRGLQQYNYCVEPLAKDSAICGATRLVFALLEASQSRS